MNIPALMADAAFSAAKVITVDVHEIEPQRPARSPLVTGVPSLVASDKGLRRPDKGDRIFKRHRTPQERAGKGSRPGPQRAEVRKSGRTQRAVRASAGSGLASWQVLERSRLAGWARPQG